MSHLHSRPGVWGGFHQTIKVDDSSKSGLIAFTQGLSCLLCSIIRASCTFTHLGGNRSWASWETSSLWHVLYAPMSLLPVGHAQNTGDVLVRCLNHLSWLLSMWSTGSSVADRLGGPKMYFCHFVCGFKPPLQCVTNRCSQRNHVIWKKQKWDPVIAKSNTFFFCRT